MAFPLGLSDETLSRLKLPYRGNCVSNKQLSQMNRQQRLDWMDNFHTGIAPHLREPFIPVFEKYMQEIKAACVDIPTEGNLRMKAAKKKSFLTKCTSVDQTLFINLSPFYKAHIISHWLKKSNNDELRLEIFAMILAAKVNRVETLRNTDACENDGDKDGDKDGDVCENASKSVKEPQKKKIKLSKEKN